MVLKNTQVLMVFILPKKFHIYKGFYQKKYLTTYLKLYLKNDYK